MTKIIVMYCTNIKLLLPLIARAVTGNIASDDDDDDDEGDNDDDKDDKGDADNDDDHHHGDRNDSDDTYVFKNAQKPNLYSSFHSLPDR